MSPQPLIHYDPQPTDTTITDILSSIAPRQGRLVPLRTKAEVEHSEPHIVQAYTIEIPQKSAHQILKTIDTILRTQHQKDDTTPIPLTHLRRVILPSALPLHLRPSSPTLQPPLPTLHLLIPYLPLEALKSTLTPLLLTPFPSIREINIPLYPPTSATQAHEWSQRFWPSVYRNHNPWGPQPVEIQRGEEGLGDVGLMMGLALRIGREGAEKGKGLGVGCLVVGKEGAVVGAGDGRWVSEKFRGEEGGCGEKGDPRGHAVMRAIGLVARKRRELLPQQSLAPSIPTPTPVTPSLPQTIEQQPTPTHHFSTKNQAPQTLNQNESPSILTPLESHLYTISPFRPNGYLCLDLSIYITHEPCVMCSMAILHSKFEKVVFGKRMGTGGLNAEVDCCDGGGIERVGERKEEGWKEDGEAGEEEQNGKEKEDIGMGENKDGGRKKVNGYGLFHRPELNWRMLAWQWLDQNTQSYATLSADTHV